MKPRSLYFIIGGIILLGVLFYTFKPKSAVAPAVNVSPSPSLEASASANPEMGKVFELVIKDNKLTSGPEIIQVNEGDEVTIRITSDADEEFHVHGYDESVKLKANVPAELKFKAKVSGRFPYELEESKTDIGALEVQPQ